MAETLSAEEFETLSVEVLLDTLIQVQSQIKTLETTAQELKAELSSRVDAGEIDPVFSWNDWSFNESEGKATYDYPSEVKEAETNLKRLRADAIANGTAIQRRGNPYWTIKPPRQ